jgi:hypothetical protein
MRDSGVIQQFGQQTLGSASFRIVPGASSQRNLRDRQARPTTVDVTVTDRQGRRARSTHRLQDGVPLVVRTDVRDAVRVRVTLGSAYGMGPGRQVAIAEIELYESRHGDRS